MMTFNFKVVAVLAIVAALLGGALMILGPQAPFSGGGDGEAPPPLSEAEVIEQTGEVRELIWQDLMPEGEEARLDALYAEFFQDLEERFAQAEQISLAEAGRRAGQDPLAQIAEGSPIDTMPQLGTFNVVETLDGQKIRLPGYIVPLDFNSDQMHESFLLVPYFGACIHSPPPPPNQIVFVRADEAVEIPSIYEPVWVEGVMRTQRHENETGDAAYTLELSVLKPYGY